MRTLLALIGLGVMACPASAATYRIHFQGSQVRAIQSGAQPLVAQPLVAQPRAGYLGLPSSADSRNLSTGVAGGTGSKFHGAGVPNQIVTFLHPYTNQAITVPLTLPVGKPKVVIRRDRVIYNYGLFGYRVIVRFLPDGKADVIYHDRVP